MKKRVLHIISSVHWRGGEQQVNALFNSASENYEHYLFCPQGAELVKRNPEKTANIFTYKKRFGFDIFAAIELKKGCQKNRIDLIHLHDSHAINTFLLASVSSMDIPAVIHRHVNFPVFSKWKYKYAKIQKIICVSEAVKKTMNFLPEEKLCVIHPAIDLQKFSSRQHREMLRKEINISPEHKLIGIVSALEQEKNIDVFLNIATAYNSINPEDQFVIIGDGSLLNSFKTQYSLSNVHFMGFRNDIQNLLPGFDLFLFTSSNEGFPLVLLEAMASKVPILSNDFPSAPELLQDGKNGWTYRDTQDAVQKIEELNSNDTLRTQLVENAFAFVEQFGLTSMQQKTESVYNQVLSQQH